MAKGNAKGTAQVRGLLFSLRRKVLSLGTSGLTTSLSGPVRTTPFSKRISDQIFSVFVPKSLLVLGGISFISDTKRVSGIEAVLSCRLTSGGLAVGRGGSTTVAGDGPT